MGNFGFDQEWDELEPYPHRAIVFPMEGSPYVGEFGNIFNPPGGWVAWFRHGGGFVQPEVTPTEFPERVKSGSQALRVFTSYVRHDAGLMQRLTVGESNRVSFEIDPHAWSGHKEKTPDGKPDLSRFPHPDDPQWSEGAGYEHVAWEEGTQPSNTGNPQQDAKANFTFRVGIDPHGGMSPLHESVIWSTGWHIYNGYHTIKLNNVLAKADDVTLFLRASTLYPYCHNDGYWDNGFLYIDLPDSQRGEPRDKTMKRTYVLLPPARTLKAKTRWKVNAAKATAEGEDYTIGSSADDAGLGDLDDRNVIAVNPNKWGKGEDGRGLGGFFEQHYPGVDVRKVEADTAGELPARLSVPFETLKVLHPRDPAPDPPPTPVIPALRPKGTIALTGIQAIGSGIPGFGEYHQVAQPTTIKTVMVCGEIAVALQYSHNTLPVHRHWTGTENDFRWAKGFTDHKTAAMAWNNLYMPQLIEEFRVKGIRDRKILVESINEVWDPALDGTWNACEFEHRFIDDVMAWNNQSLVRDLGILFVPVVVIAGVGNPLRYVDPNGPATWEMLWSLGQHTMNVGGVWGPHNYWYADMARPHLYAELAPYLQHRWRSFRQTLAVKGIAVNWYFGETGPIGGHYDEETGDMWLNPSAGWRKAYGNSAAGWARTKSEIVKYERELREYDPEGLVIGHGLYQCGSHDDQWRDGFEYAPRLPDLAHTLRGEFG